MTIFKILWAIDLIGSLIVVYFFITGLADGTVSSRNIVLWLAIDAALAAILFGTIWLKNNQHYGLAISVLLIPAIPSLLFGIYMLIAGNQKWN